MSDSRGRLITIEGGEGAGKTSCVETVAARLRSHGVDVVRTREPGGTALGESVRALLLDPDNAQMSPDAETLLIFAARAEHLASVIRPALEAGQWVVCDRFTDASYAYQGAGRGLGAARIAALEEWTQGDLRPDLTILLEVPVEVGRRRAAERSEPDRFERERDAFFERVRAGYAERALAEPARIRRVNAEQPPATVSGRITALIDALVTGRSPGEQAQ